MRHPLLAAILLVLLQATSASAAESPHIQVRLQGEPRAAEPGQRYEGLFELSIGEDLEVYGFQLEGDGWVDLRLSPPARTDFQKGDKLRFRFSGTPGPVVTPLDLSYESKGAVLHRSIDLSAARIRTISESKETIEFASASETFVKLNPAHERPEPDQPARYSFEKPLRAVDPAPELSKGHIVAISGRFIYLDRNGNPRGADGVSVHCYDEDWDWDEHLGSTTTDSDGYFSFAVFASEAAPDLYLEYHAVNFWVTMEEDSIWEDNYDDWRSPVYDNYTGGSLNFGSRKPVGDTGQRVLHILSSLTRAVRWSFNLGYAVPPVDCQFPEIGANAKSHYDGEIHITWTKGWEERVHVHEWGHHWVHSFAVSGTSGYDNGICDGATPGHCIWCEETALDAWSEGFPDWMSQAVTSTFSASYGDTPLFQYSFESTTTTCIDAVNNMLCQCDPLSTEGYFATALWDIFDDATETDDPNVPGLYNDELSMGPEEILATADSFHPLSPLQFLAFFLADNPSVKSQIWSTARNNGYELDTNPPGVVQGIGAFSHSLNQPSHDGTVELYWDPAPDDAAGTQRYKVSASLGGAADPGMGPQNAFTERFTTAQLSPPGEYWINIRALDRSGKWSNDYVSWGPVVILDPLPADVAPFIPTGWNDPVVPRESGGAAAGNVPDPVVLMGDQAATFWNAAGNNIGGLATPGPFDISFSVDGVERDMVRTAGPLDVGALLTILNQGPIVVPAGRHSVEVFFDAAEEMAENTEGNNWAWNQWIWRPSQAFTSSVRVLRDAPPKKDGGWEHIEPSSFPPSNCDGLRMNMVPHAGASRFFAGIAIHAKNDAHDYDASLEFESTAAWNGFGGYLHSQQPAGLLDAVIANGVLDTQHDIWDVGVYNNITLPNETPSQYVAGFARGKTIALGETEILHFESDEMMKLREFAVTGNELGWAEAILDVGENAAFTVAWLNSSFLRGTLQDASGSRTTDATGEAHLGMGLTSAGQHCLVIYRNPTASTDAVDVTLSLSEMYSDAVCSSTSGWEQPLMPGSVIMGAGEIPLSPVLLPGGVASTFVNFSLLNDSPHPLDPMFASVELDGQPELSVAFDIIDPDAWAQHYGTTPIVVPGGRHTLALRLDPTDQVTERREDNNDYSWQWVWDPPDLPDGPLAQPLPPDPTAGWEFHPPDPILPQKSAPGGGAPEDPVAPSSLSFNCQGFRIPDPTTTPKFMAVATIPASTADVDLSLHAPSQGATDGFAEALAHSGWGGDASDFVLISRVAAENHPYDVGVVLSDPGVVTATSYTVQKVESAALPREEEGSYGPFTLADRQILNLHEVPLTPGPHVFLLENVSGSVDWGMTLYSSLDAYQGKSDYVDNARGWFLGEGEGELFTVTVPEDGLYCLAVWKKDALSLDELGQYTIALDRPLTVGDGAVDDSKRQGLTGVHPNPFNPRTTISFVLHESGPVSLSVYDVRGARVRTLVDGPMSPGSHRVQWNGADDTGNRVASGVYFVRMVATGVRDLEKLMLLK